MRNRDDMTFPMEEHERRLEALRERMAERRLDAVIISDPANILYLTEHQTPVYTYFQCVVVPLEKEPFMVTRQMEASNIEARTWVEDYTTYPDTGDAIETLYKALCERGLGRKRIGYERNSYFFPAYHQDQIKTALADGELVDCYGIVEEGRICKSECEIEVMKRAARATEAGMKAAWEAVAPGVTENEIAGAACEAMFSAGGEYPAVLPFVTSGPRTMIGHATWEGREVKAGEHVYLELGGCYRRYHTAMMRTVVLGELSGAMAEAENVMLSALDEAYKLLKPGVTASDADLLIRNIILDNSSGASLITRAGYSIGISFPPSWDEGYMLSLKQGNSTYLKPGMTLHLIPWMWGIDGDKTAGISDTLLITEDGCESFYTLDREFVVKG